MKTLLLLLSLLLATAAEAQTFGGGTSVTGTTNAPMQYNGVIPTNAYGITFPAKPFTLSGVTNTNEVAVIGYGFQVVGTTNVFTLGSVTNTFTNGATTWVTNIPTVSYTIQVVPYASANVGSTNTNTIYAP